MGRTEDEATVRRWYQAYAEQDGATLLELTSETAVVHVSGRHPLSGVNRGTEEIFGYMGRVGAWTGGEGGFEVHDVLSGEDGQAAAVVTGTAMHEGQKFERQLVHLFRLKDGKIQEFRDLPFDQHAEDAFWSGP
ncbi:MAG: uncharacterized protein QOH29_534 [Actinomycetota bacterium]|nr:uncharacterized protein [Actinomycetota bacterium]